jgi:hypothetical protein
MLDFMMYIRFSDTFTAINRIFRELIRKFTGFIRRNEKKKHTEAYKPTSTKIIIQLKYNEQTMQ